jgi:Flp pilus assembly protein TadG
MAGPKEVPVRRGSFVNVLLARLRRRSAGVGMLMILLLLLVLSLLVFALCACKSLVRGPASSP